MTYSIHLYDRAGEYTYETVATFHEAIKVVEKFTRQYPTKVVGAFNDDQVDAGFDGLTDDERDAIDRAVNETVRCAEDDSVEREIERRAEARARALAHKLDCIKDGGT